MAPADHPLVVGARGSPLSRAQAMTVIETIKSLNPSLSVEFQAIKTAGDDQRVDLAAGGGPKGLFVKEIEAALLDGRIDLAIHSAKDMPFQLPQGLVLGPTPKRAPAGDLLCCAGDCDLDSLPPGARLGTSGVRRKAFLLFKRPDLAISPLRGNVATRLSKMRSSLDATIIAAAAAERLPDLKLGRFSPIPVEILPPAPGQGALALELREEDERVLRLIEPLGDLPSSLALSAERAFSGRLNAGCQVPAAAWARILGQKLVMLVALAHPEGESVASLSLDCPASGAAAAEALGRLAAEKLLSQAERNAPEILKALPSRPGI